MRYKVDDKVWLRDDLEEYNLYGRVDWVPQMLRGVEATITVASDYFYRIKGSMYDYTDEMIDHDKTARLHRDQQEELQPEIAESPGGGKKDDGGKLMLQLIDAEFLHQVGEVLTFGANKYSPYNWRGLDKERVEGSLLRHINNWRRGEQYDKDSPNAHNLIAATANLMFLWYLDVNGEDRNGQND